MSKVTLDVNRHIKMLIKMLKLVVGWSNRVHFLLASAIALFLMLPYSLLTKKNFRESFGNLLPRFILSDIEIEFEGVKYIARGGCSDIVILMQLCEEGFSHFKIRREEVVIDVGAHIGLYALYAAKKGKLCIAIEPCSKNFEHLLRNIQINGLDNLIALNYAAWNSDEDRVPLYGPSQKNADNVLSIDREHLLRELSENGAKIYEYVETRTIDSILDEIGINKVDWVKIDVEGAEVEVLQGMKKCLRDNPNLKILIEVQKENEAKVNSLLKGFNRVLLIERARTRDFLYTKNKNISSK